MRIRNTVVALFCLLVCTVAVLADTLTLKDGTVLQGKVQEVGDKYWIKLTDGGTRTIPKSEVTKFEKGDGAAKPATPKLPDSKATPAAAPAAGASGTSAAFVAVKAKADKVMTPVEALQLWDAFSERELSAADAAATKVELAKWQKLQKDNAEKINGKWVGGAERKKILKDVEALVRQGYKDIQGSNTVDGLEKLEKAIKIYPNSFEANFELGYYHLKKGVIGSNGRGNLSEIDKGIKSLEVARAILPKSPATLSNLAIGYNFRKRYAESVTVAYQAAKIRETKDVVQNLVNAIAYAPPGLQQNNKKLKPILEDAILIAQKHGLSLAGSGSWPYIRPESTDGPAEGAAEGDGPEEKGPPGVVWSGSGFFVTSDGYIITNHHVATGDPKTPIKRDIGFRVRFDDGSEKRAELIAVDDAADIALMKIKTDSPVPFLPIVQDDPKQAARALVLGYPATSESGPGTNVLQVAEGSVKSLNPGDEHEVWFDLSTTHGNSGGPIVDKNGRVIAILTGGRTVFNVTYVLGVGPHQIHRFMDSLGDKAPKVTWDPAPTSGGELNGEALTESCRKSTLMIFAIRGDKSEGVADGDDKSGSGGASGGSETGGDGKTPAGQSGGGAAPEKPAG